LGDQRHNNYGPPRCRWRTTGAALALLVIGFSPVRAGAVTLGQTRTQTGYFYPSDKTTPSKEGQWLRQGPSIQGDTCPKPRDYVPGEFHLGADFFPVPPETLNVYAIADGTVLTTFDDGSGNQVLEILHTNADGSQFMAVYGHVVDVTGDTTVSAGQVVAQIGNLNHVHFGIHPGTEEVTTNWGELPCHEWGGTNNGFVDPVQYIKTHVPLRAPAWQSWYDAASSCDLATGLAISPNGSRVFVTGSSGDCSSTDDMATVAFDATGARLWAAGYDGPAHGVDGARGLAVSPDGSRVFVTGSSQGADGFGDYATVAYDALDGTELWAARLDRGSDVPTAIGLSPDGNTVFVTGSAGCRIFLQSGVCAVTVAYQASTGTQLWISTYRSFDSIANRLAVSPDGSRVFVTGATPCADCGLGYTDYLTMALDPGTGHQLWASTYDGSAQQWDAAKGLGVGPDGRRVFVTGNSAGIGDGDVATIAYSAQTGAQLWVVRYQATDAEDLAVAPDGSRLFVTGGLSDTGFFAVTISYGTRKGNEIWARQSDPSLGTSAGVAVAVSPDGAHVYSAGQGSSGFFERFQVLAYGATNGQLEWVGRYGDDIGSASAIVVTPGTAAAIVTGWAVHGPGADGAEDFLTESFTP
jgi:hypothetical protein